MGRIVHNKLSRWFFHQNFFLFCSTWVIILSSAIPACAAGSQTGNGFKNMPKTRGGSMAAAVRPGRSNAMAPKATPSSAPLKVDPVIVDMLPPTTGTPNPISSMKIGIENTAASKSSTDNELPVIHIAVTQNIPAVDTVSAASALFLKTFVAALASVWRDYEKIVKTLVAGAASGIISRTCTSPLEVVATLQMSGFATGGNIADQLGALYNQGGGKAFFRGNGANCLKVAPTRAIQFAFYERIKQFILFQSQLRAKPGAEVMLSPYGRLCAGGVAGMIAASFVYPLEVVKTMLTVASPGAYKGIFDAFGQAYASGGVQGFYRGWLPTMFAMFPYVGVEFMIYETFKQMYTQRQLDLHGEKANTDLPPLVHLALGACAGAAAQTAAHPLDVVRRRLQMQGKNGNPVEFTNMFTGLYHMTTKEGLPALYRGLRPACAEKIPSTAVTFFVYEFLKKHVFGLSSL